MRKLALCYIWSVFATGVVTIAASAFALHAHEVPLLLAIAGAALVVEAWGTSLYSDSRVSVSFALVVAAAVLVGFPGGAIVGAGAGLGTLFHRRDLHKFAFNLGVLSLSGGAMGAALDVLGATHPSTLPWPLIVLSLAFAATADYVVNSALVAVVIGLTSRRGPVAVWMEKHRWLYVHYLALAAIGLGLAQGYTLAGAMGVAIFLIPAIMQRVSMAQYVRQTQRSVQQLQESHVTLAKSHAGLQQAHDDLSRLTRRLEETYDGTLLALVRALDARDSATRGHSERVAAHTTSMARRLGFKEGTDEWNTIVRGALLHDIGKIGIADAILLKPGRLTEDEQLIMREHAQIGFQMLHEIPFLAGAARIVLSHHERWDGKGYPRGLAREQIPIGARLFAIADTFDAMISDRPYRKALPLDQVVAEVLRNRGSQFDPGAVELFLADYQAWLAQYGSDVLRSLDQAA